MERERERERVVRLDVVVNGFREKEELWMCVFFFLLLNRLTVAWNGSAWA